MRPKRQPREDPIIHAASPLLGATREHGLNQFTRVCKQRRPTSEIVGSDVFVSRPRRVAARARAHKSATRPALPEPTRTMSDAQAARISRSAAMSPARLWVPAVASGNGPVGHCRRPARQRRPLAALAPGRCHSRRDAGFRCPRTFQGCGRAFRDGQGLCASKACIDARGRGGRQRQRLRGVIERQRAAP